jgi:hypothetical protein
MPDLEINVSMLKCPICDLNHSYKVRVEYDEKRDALEDTSSIFYNTFATTKKIGDKIVEVQVYEIDAFCQKNGIPFRMIVDPPLPSGTVPTKFSVTSSP